MSAGDRSFVTMAHKNVKFEGQSVYLSGHSYENCVFRQCTLIVKDFTKIGIVRDCQFDRCVWHLNVTVFDRNAWREFLTSLAPAILNTLPEPTESP